MEEKNIKHFDTSFNEMRNQVYQIIRSNTLPDGTYNPYLDLEWMEFEYLSYDFSNKKLKYKIVKHTVAPKITRYVTHNYERTPIYGDISERTKIIKTVDKTINPIKFVNDELPELDFDKELKLNIIDVIDIMPHWRDQELRIESLENKINTNESKIRHYETEKQSYNYKLTNLTEKPSNFWLRFIFSFLTLGLSFIGFVSKRRAIVNGKINNQNKEWNNKHKISIDQNNLNLFNEIQINNDNITNKNNILNKKIIEINDEEFNPIVEDEDGWIMIKEASEYNYETLKGLKGVYIIKNIEKNIYYVGQSKNLQKRLNDHFKNGTVNNLKFAKDFYGGDNFCFKYKVLETKDELDSEEKRLIEYYNSFENGYNATGGNI